MNLPTRSRALLTMGVVLVVAAIATRLAHVARWPWLLGGSGITLLLAVAALASHDNDHRADVTPGGAPPDDDGIDVLDAGDRVDDDADDDEVAGGGDDSTDAAGGWHGPTR